MTAAAAPAHDDLSNNTPLESAPVERRRREEEKKERKKEGNSIRLRTFEDGVYRYEVGRYRRDDHGECEDQELVDDVAGRGGGR